MAVPARLVLQGLQELRQLQLGRRRLAALGHVVRQLHLLQEAVVGEEGALVKVGAPHKRGAVALAGAARGILVRCTRAAAREEAVGPGCSVSRMRSRNAGRHACFKRGMAAKGCRAAGAGSGGGGGGGSAPLTQSRLHVRLSQRGQQYLAAAWEQTWHRAPASAACPSAAAISRQPAHCCVGFSSFGLPNSRDNAPTPK